MNLGKAGPQMSRQLELPCGEASGTRGLKGSVEAGPARKQTERSAASGLMAKVLAPENLKHALKRVKKNKGSPGIDGMTVGELSEYLRQHWSEVREQLLTNRYQPSEVKQQLIPKSGGGERQLGIPMVLDRFIQQALLQALTPIFDPSFSDSSYGFRLGRSAHQAVKAAREYVSQGKRVVVDVDLSKFFDRVNHDVLMGKLAKRIEDKLVLRLIRRYLGAGLLANGVVVERHEGTPQGGPLSPLLANILLDEVDKELQKRGHSFARYADDCNVYVRSKRACERVMAALRNQFAKLRLVVNEEKSAVDWVNSRQFLGYCLWRDRKRQTRYGVSRKALKAFKARVRDLKSRTRGRSFAQVVGELKPFL